VLRAGCQLFQQAESIKALETTCNSHRKDLAIAKGQVLVPAFVSSLLIPHDNQGFFVCQLGFALCIIAPSQLKSRTLILLPLFSRLYESVGRLTPDVCEFFGTRAYCF
jgi:hypothetical protein